MKYLLDTDTCIHVFRGKSSVVERMEQVSGDDLAISSITYYELAYGAKRCARKREELRKVQTFVQHIHQLVFGPQTALQAAGVRQILEERGTGIGPMDTLIAATALEAGLILVTGNRREFSRVPGLRCESWDH
jgi:tRNA(fMet)-specific endonuclease VapC